MILIAATTGHNIVLVLEYCMIGVIVLIQLYIFFSLKKEITIFSKTFQNKLTIIKGKFDKTRLKTSTDILKEVKNNSHQNTDYLVAKGSILNNVDPDNLIKLSLVDTNNENKAIVRIKNTLNTYLINNYGAAVNFSIIRDIVDREVDVNDEAISQSLPIPLYLGLAATMTGIIFGLFSMPSINGEGFELAINSLITGVKSAMIASLIGLGLTTWLTSFIYKKAKRQVLIDKNDQLSYLQAELLPELVKAEETGISGLKASLDRFAREATTISANVLSASNITNENIKKQNEIIQRVERLDMTKITRVNLELFDRIESNFLMLNKFNGYITALNNISENLIEFSKRSSDVEVIASEIKENMINSNAVIRLIESHTTALTEHIEQIRNSGGAASDAVNLADSTFRDAITNLQLKINNSIDELTINTNFIDDQLKNHFENISIRLGDVTSIHLNELSSAYQSSIPNFEKLDNLIHIPEIKENTIQQSEQLLNAINQLNQSLSNVTFKINYQSVLNKLDEIEKSLKQKKTSQVPPPPPIPIPKPKVGFFKKFRERFFKKNKTKRHEK